MVSPRSGTPLYLQVAEDLRDKIRSGVFPPGTRLRPEPRLAAEYDVGRDTVRDALFVLKAEGLIDTRRGFTALIRDAPPRERIWLRPGESVSARMPTPTERSDRDVPPGVPVFVVGDQLYPADRFEFVAR